VSDATDRDVPDHHYTRFVQRDERAQSVDATATPALVAKKRRSALHRRVSRRPWFETLHTKWSLATDVQTHALVITDIPNGDIGHLIELAVSARFVARVSLVTRTLEEVSHDHE
jgi:hypothetical protein